MMQHLEDVLLKFDLGDPDERLIACDYLGDHSTADVHAILHSCLTAPMGKYHQVPYHYTHHFRGRPYLYTSSKLTNQHHILFPSDIDKTQMVARKIPVVTHDAVILQRHVTVREELFERLTMTLKDLCYVTFLEDAPAEFIYIPYANYPIPWAVLFITVVQHHQESLLLAKMLAHEALQGGNVSTSTSQN